MTDNLLAVRETFCNGKIVCRFLRQVTTSEPTIVAIPGGPGLSSQYLDPFMRKLSERTEANVATMDLPNHGESKVSDGALTYMECLSHVRQSIEEIQKRSKSLLVFGQSFGARLAFDLLAELDRAPSATLLTGFPYVFRISSTLMARLNELPLESEEGPEAKKIHAENWKKTIPVYAVKPLPPEVFSALAKREEVRDSHKMLEGARPIEQVAKAIDGASILIVEAERDLVVPDDNWKVLRTLLPTATFAKAEGVGHFPMAEDPEAVLRAFSAFISGRTR